ncbi:MAG TPA: poly(3-hydroxyalkanoate) synthetase, partial [Pseudolabrys sp.]|nr:poly(3-hydroxyalkanoate) synthetase [Pseudolabrys sp.]
EAFAVLQRRFRDWYAWTVNLPGSYYLDAIERLFRRNELARGGFVALGKRIDLACLRTPLYLLAARDDELVAPAQLFALAHLTGAVPAEIHTALAPCGHLGLFMGRNVLREHWPGVAQWLGESDGGRR